MWPIFPYCREMMACDYYHFSPKKVEYNYPPSPYRSHAKKLRKFFKAYNVTHVVTYHGMWKRYMRKRPKRFQHVATIGETRPKYIYSVIGKSSMFMEGEGTVEADINRIRVRLPYDQKRVVIKYNYAKDLKVNAPAVLKSYKVDKRIKLIAIEPNGERDLVISFNRFL